MKTGDTVRRNIRRLREESGRTKTDLCASINMSRRFWDDVENGVKEPSITTLERIAEALDVTLQILLTEPSSSGQQNPNGNGHKSSNGRKKRREPAGAKATPKRRR
jgi:transcriptional regulator with XRE-family HTH domain